MSKMTSSQEYAEKLSEDPSQFYDDEPEESKAAAEAAVNAAAVKVVKKAADVGNEESDEMKKLRADLAAAKLEAANAKAEVIAVKSAKKKRAPKGLYKAQCDDTMKKINPTLKYIFTNHKEQHRELYMLGLFVKDYTDAATESADHDAYKRWLSDNKQYVGLKKVSRKSTNASLNEISFNETIEESTDEDEDEDGEEAGAA
jgi:hypothetical protein